MPVSRRGAASKRGIARPISHICLGDRTDYFYWRYLSHMRILAESQCVFKATGSTQHTV